MMAKNIQTQELKDLLAYYHAQLSKNAESKEVFAENNEMDVDNKEGK